MHSTIGKCGKVNVLYGENNAGKSNVLAALETLFKVEKVEELESRVGGFIRGELSNFVDNFTLGTNVKRGNIIKITAQVGLDDNDLVRMPKFDAFIKANGIFKRGHNQWVVVEVEVESTGHALARRTVRKAVVNNHVMFDFESSDRYFPNLKVDSKTRLDAGEEVFSCLINSFAIIRAERFLRNEKVEDEALYPLLQNGYFKRFLLELSLSREPRFKVFEEIVKNISAKPFNFGQIRPVVEDGNVELLVKDSQGRELMVARVGTGVQQIIVLVSHIASSSARIIGIEEIELNLSPSLQYRLLELLKDMVGKSPNVIDQLFITSHSYHLSMREDVCLYAVAKNDTGETNVSWGPAAVSGLRKHFDFGLFKLPRTRSWRS